MGYAKISVTVPQEVYEEIRDFSSRNGVKLSHLVTEALSDKLRKMRDEALLEQINRAYGDPKVSEEQRLMAESIADNIDVGELPW